MNAIWIAFFAGIFIGANIGIVLIAILTMASDYDKHLPDLDDVQVE